MEEGVGLEKGGGRVRQRCVVGKGEGSGGGMAVGEGSEAEEGKKKASVAAVRGVGLATGGAKNGGGPAATAAAK